MYCSCVSKGSLSDAGAVVLKTFSSDHCRSVLEKAGHNASCSFTRGWGTKLSLCPPGCCFLTASGSGHSCSMFSVVTGPGDGFTSGMAIIWINVSHGPMLIFCRSQDPYFGGITIVLEKNKYDTDISCISFPLTLIREWWALTNIIIDL